MADEAEKRRPLPDLIPRGRSISESHHKGPNETLSLDSIAKRGCRIASRARRPFAHEVDNLVSYIVEAT